MLKKALILVTIIVVLIFTAVFIYRQTIIQYSVEKIVRDNLPGYIKFDNIHFDLAKNSISLNRLKVLNPPDFSSAYFMEVESVSCKYRIIGGLVPRGLAVSEIIIRKPDITIERLKDGRVNAAEMQKFVDGFSGGKAALNQPQEDAKTAVSPPPAGIKLSNIIKLPSSVAIKNARVAFLDRQPYDKAHLIQIDDVMGDVAVSLDEYYTRILNMSFTFEGVLNDEPDAAIKWIASLNPTTPQLTMSNRFNVSNLDILALEPYYDKYSPFVFERGKFSGELVFDFDKGNIGSTNVIRLSNIRFWVKPGYENAEMWGSTVQDVMKYFTTATGDIVFDFKIKGDMSKPEFMLGPISKRAITSMALDKISKYAVEAVTKNPQEAAKENLGKAGQYIEMFKDFIQKK